MRWATGERLDQPNAYGIWTDGSGEASQARLQALPFCLHSDKDPLFKVYGSDGSPARETEKSRGSMGTRPNARTQTASQDKCLPNRLGIMVRLGMEKGHEGLCACYTHHHAAPNGSLGCTMAAVTDKAEMKRTSKNIHSLRLARLEQASFGTGIRRASHCATTPLRLCLDSWDGSLLGRYGTGVGLGALARAYKC